MDTVTHIKHSDIKELLHQIRYELQQSQRPANEVILDDQDVMRKLKISKRKLQYMIADGTLTPRKFDINSPRRYYLLSDLLDPLNQTGNPFQKSKK